MVGGSATAVAPGQVPDEAPGLTTVPWLSGSVPVWNNSHGWSRFQMRGFRTQNWGSHSLISVYGGMIGVYLNEVEVRGDRQWAEPFPMSSVFSCALLWCCRLDINLHCVWIHVAVFFYRLQTICTDRKKHLRCFVTDCLWRWSRSRLLYYSHPFGKWLAQ